MANMAVEAGAKNGIMAPDEITLDYVKGRTLRPYTLYGSDPGAPYLLEQTYEVSGLEPQVACPSSPGNVVPVSRVGDVAHRSGGDRLLHQRADRRPASGRQGPQRPPGGQRRAPHRHPRHARWYGARPWTRA